MRDCLSWPSTGWSPKSTTPPVAAAASPCSSLIRIIDEGFRLTYGGYDYLALHALAARGSVEGVGRQIGVGKESDVYLVAGRRPPVVEDAATTETNAETKDAAPPTSDDDRRGMGNEDDGEASLESFVLKIERLGRTSFRSVKSNRDYVGHRKHVSWMYMSRLAAEKEWAFLRALHARGFPTPRPIDWNRHCIVMEWIDGRVLDQLHPEDWPVTVHVPLLQIAQHLYSLLMRLLVRLAEHGLIHGDFNEFNLMVREAYLAAPTLAEQDEASSPASSPIVIIDFPQMVSTAHRNARELFDRDVNCLRTFFRRRFGFEAAEWPDFDRDVQVEDDGQLLDAQLKASGFKGRLNDADGEDSEDCSDDGDADSEDHCRDDPSSDPE